MTNDKIREEWESKVKTGRFELGTYGMNITAIADWWLTKIDQVREEQKVKGERNRLIAQVREEEREKVITEIMAKGQKLRRTDETQMSHDHVYDEALTDYDKVIGEI